MDEGGKTVGEPDQPMLCERSMCERWKFGREVLHTGINGMRTGRGSS